MKRQEIGLNLTEMGRPVIPASLKASTPALRPDLQFNCIEHF
jgi:hypothetical protein